MNNRILVIPKYSASLCLLVILIHNSIPSYFDYTGIETADSIHYFLTLVLPKLTSVAVPSFFILSGFLFYRNYDYSKTLEKYKSRFRSLVIPYLVFNAIGLGVEMLTKIPFFEEMATYKTDPFSVKNILTGLFFHKYTVLWFVFALIIYSLLCPIFYTILRKKWLGIIVILAIFFLVSSGLFSLVLPNGLYFETTSLIYYLIGGFLGIHIKAFYNNPVTTPLAFLSSVLFFLIVYFELKVATHPVLSVFVLIMKCFLYWWAFAFFAKYLKTREWHSYSFFIYLSFLPIIRLTSGMLRYFTSRFGFISPANEAILFVLTFVITLFSCICLAKIWKRLSPRSFHFVTGNRG